MSKIIVFNSALCPDSEAVFKIALEGGETKVYVVILPGKDVNLDIDCTLRREGSHLEIAGLFIASGTQKVSVKANISHLVGNSYSIQEFKGIATDKSHVKFSGTILVAHDAQKTEAYQKNNNLLLSEGARVDSEPQLEIYADDVKCSHGATVARLDPAAQFYMQSRGIGVDEAQYLQCISFLSPVLAGLSDELSDEVIENVRLICGQMSK